jgi:hypothetical protein
MARKPGDVEQHPLVEAGLSWLESIAGKTGVTFLWIDHTARAVACQFCGEHSTLWLQCKGADKPTAIPICPKCRLGIIEAETV